MLDEYVVVPDVFDQSAYSNPAFIEMCLPYLKEPLLQESLVRDLCDGGWSRYCIERAGTLHRLCKEIIRKLETGNRLRRFPRKGDIDPGCAADWCNEGLGVDQQEAITGVIAAHATKQVFESAKVASIEKLTGTNWWQSRTPSVTLDRKTPEYLRVLHRVLQQANSLMFIDPNLDPSAHSYREFAQLLLQVTGRAVKPRIEIHRSLAKGDGPARTFPTVAQWQTSFAGLGGALQQNQISVEVFGWDDFHDRHLITDIIGMNISAGFDVSGILQDLATWGRLGREDKDRIQRLYDPAVRAPRWRFKIGA